MQLSVLFINTSTHFTKFSQKLNRLNAQSMYSFIIVSKAALQSSASNSHGLSDLSRYLIVSSIRLITVLILLPFKVLILLPFKVLILLPFKHVVLTSCSSLILHFITISFGTSALSPPLPWRLFNILVRMSSAAVWRRSTFLDAITTEQPGEKMWKLSYWSSVYNIVPLLLSLQQYSHGAHWSVGVHYKKWWLIST